MALAGVGAALKKILGPLLHLSRDLYLRFHWATLAAVLLPREELVERARQELFRLQLCIEACEDRELAEAFERERGIWHGVLAGLELPLDSVLAPPPPRDPLAVSFCPVCSSQFGRSATRCVDCQAELRPLGAAQQPTLPLAG